MMTIYVFNNFPFCYIKCIKNLKLIQHHCLKQNWEPNLNLWRDTSCLGK